MIVTDKLAGVYEALKDKLGLTNKMAAPKITKVLVSVGTGKRARFDKSVHELVADRLGRITGQKPSPRSAKKSIAGFKIRQGDQVGQVVTLRGKRMEEFLEKLIHISLPRTKDFRGLNRSAVDSMGNLTIGIREHTIFPECAEEDLKDVFGLAITVVTTARNRDDAMAFFDYLGVPFKKEAAK
jgi:large subunit ribosomal protein L5